MTNNWIDDIHGAATTGLSDIFPHVDVVIESCKVGIRKPDVEIYQLACCQLGVTPAKVLSCVILKIV